jgi:hypothetical protein
MVSYNMDCYWTKQASGPKALSSRVLTASESSMRKLSHEEEYYTGKWCVMLSLSGWWGGGWAGVVGEAARMHQTPRRVLEMKLLPAVVNSNCHFNLK